MSSFRWQLDLSEQGSVAAPPGFVARTPLPVATEQQTAASAEDAKQRELQSRKAMEHARAPFGRLFFTGLMLWMTGGMNIFSLIMTAMSAWSCLQSFLNVNNYFAAFATSPGSNRKPISLLLPKIVFTLGNVAQLGLVLWKCRSLGLLPTAADWTPAVLPHFSELSVF